MSSRPQPNTNKSKRRNVRSKDSEIVVQGIQRVSLSSRQLARCILGYARELRELADEQEGRSS